MVDIEAGLVSEFVMGEGDALYPTLSTKLSRLVPRWTNSPLSIHRRGRRRALVGFPDVP